MIKCDISSIQKRDIYHGSNDVIVHPNLKHSRDKLDFGKGFYTTTNREQAVEFSKKVTLIRKKGNPIINIYKWDLDANSNLKIKEFSSTNEEWLDFVSSHRLGNYFGEKYDIVIGPVANDKVIATLNLYLDGILSKETTLIQLKINETYDQIVFLSENALNSIVFKKSENV